MSAIQSVTLDTADAVSAAAFYRTLGVDRYVRVRAAESPLNGYRAFTLSLVVSQPATVDALVGAALGAGATVLKPFTKSIWGYGGVLRAPDDSIWKVATSAKKDTGPATRQIDDTVLLLGVVDVPASKRFYLDHGLSVSRSFGRKYVEFAAPPAAIKLVLYDRRALAKDAGVSPEGNGPHGIAINSDAGDFSDPDGFRWESAQAPDPRGALSRDLGAE